MVIHSRNSSGNNKRIIPIFIFVSMILLIAYILTLLFTKSYYPPHPIDLVTKRELVSLLSKSDQELIKIIDEDHYSWYGFKGNQGVGKEALIGAMKARGLTFVEQLGSGYIFEDESQQITIVTSQMWTGKYVLYQMPNGKHG